MRLPELISWAESHRDDLNRQPRDNKRAMGALAFIENILLPQLEKLKVPKACVPVSPCDFNTCTKWLIGACTTYHDYNKNIDNE